MTDIESIIGPPTEVKKTEKVVIPVDIEDADSSDDQDGEVIPLKIRSSDEDVPEVVVSAETSKASKYVDVLQSVNDILDPIDQYDYQHNREGQQVHKVVEGDVDTDKAKEFVETLKTVKAGLGDTENSELTTNNLGDVKKAFAKAFTYDGVPRPNVKAAEDHQGQRLGIKAAKALGSPSYESYMDGADKDDVEVLNMQIDDLQQKENEELRKAGKYREKKSDKDVSKDLYSLIKDIDFPD